MDSGVIIALILGAANIVSSIFFGWIPSLNKERLRKLDKKVNSLRRSVSFFVEEEKYILQRLAEKEDRPVESIKKELRKQVKDTTGKQLDESFRPGHY